jgi:serine/threonine protein kinase
VTEGVAQDVRLLAGRYQVGELIGRGGMADVHVGTDARLGRRVAIKLLKPALASDPAFRTRFRREAQDAAKMAHPTIVRIYDAGEETITDPTGRETQLPFIVMEYVDGRLLKDILAEGPLAPAEAVRIAEQVLTALEYSHRAGVVHRDIKPGNIMITSNGQVKVMDFGIARAISDSSATIAETSAIVGTAQYFSPEQARGESVDARSDLYSTGVVLFELLTGQAPFRGANPVAVAYQHVNQNPAPPSSINPRVTPALDAVVLHALSKDRFNRFQSAAEFRQDVEAASQGTVPPRKVPSPVTDFNNTLFGVNPDATSGSEATLRQLRVDQDSRLARTQSRPPVAWIWAGVAVLVVVVAAVIFWTVNLQKEALPNTLSVIVPSVAGQAYETGAKALMDSKLVPSEVDIADDKTVQGAIIRTDPPAGSSVQPGADVRVYVSAGAAKINLPSLSGFSLTNAKKEISNRGLTVGKITHDNSPNIKTNVVINATPRDGSDPSELSAKDVIDIVISTGKVSVPKVVGMTAPAAGDALSALQLPVTVVTDATCTGNKVSNQSLAPGTHPQKSKITITICTG